MQWAIITAAGNVLHEPDWTCPADVLRAMHGHGVTVPPGALLCRADPTQPWHTQHPAPTGGTP